MGVERGDALTGAEQNTLITAHLDLVPKIAAGFRGGDVEFEELCAIGAEALTRAGRSFDGELSKFSSWATTKIEISIRDAIRSGKYDQTSEEIEATLADSDSIERVYEWSGWGNRGNASAICETWANLDESTPEDLAMLYDDIKGRRSKFEAAFISLTGNQRKLVRWVYLIDLPMSIPQAARELGVSRFQAGRMLKRALKTMGEVIARMDTNSEGNLGGVRRTKQATATPSGKLLPTATVERVGS